MPSFTIDIVTPRPPLPTMQLPDPLSTEAKQDFGRTLWFALMSHEPGSELRLTGEGVAALAAAITPADLPAEPRPAPYNIMSFQQMCANERVYVYILQALALGSDIIQQRLEQKVEFCQLTYRDAGGIGITFKRNIST